MAIIAHQSAGIDVPIVEIDTELSAVLKTPILPDLAELNVYEIAEYMRDADSGAISIDEGPFLWQATSHILIEASRDYLLKVQAGQMMCRVTDLTAAPNGITETIFGTLLIPIEDCEAVPDKGIIRKGDNIILHGVSRATKKYDTRGRFNINDSIKNVLYLPLKVEE